MRRNVVAPENAVALAGQRNGRSTGNRARSAALLAFLLMLLAAAATISNLSAQLPAALWARAVLAPDIDDMRQVLVHYSFLPRLAVSLLCGAALGLAGAVLQQVLRNPLASPETIGVSAGAYLALALATLVSAASSPMDTE